jgi:sensor histidine kinase YesM
MTPHFIFNSLSVIQGMILNQEENKASIYLSKFSKLMRLILENSRNKTVSLDNELQALNYYLELQNIRFQNRFTYKISIDDKINLEELFIPPMIIQPFVENITEHAFNPQKKEGKIIIDIQKHDSHITCKIIDNGIGINAVKKAVKNQKKSLSTTITLERLQHLSKEFKTNPSVLIQDRSNFSEQGTIVSLNIPFKQTNND